MGISRLKAVAVVLLTSCSASLSATEFRSEHGYVVDRGDTDEDRFLSNSWRIERHAKHDLLLKHLRHNGQLWIQVVKLDEEHLEMPPGVLARNFVENLAGGSWSIRLDGRRFVGREVRWASYLVDEQSSQVDGQPAHIVLVDVANVDQLQMDENARSARAAVALIRGPVFRVERSGERVRRWPQLLIVGYANAPEEFNDDIDAFEQLLRSIHFEGDR